MVFKRCCICGRLYDGEGYDARPYKTGYACNECNYKIVYPAKRNFKLKKKNY